VHDDLLDLPADSAHSRIQTQTGALRGSSE
jgi:hypothetical protein